MQEELFSCVLQPDSRTVGCRVPNDGNLFGGRQNESAGGQAAVLGRGRKCCAGLEPMTSVAFWLSNELAVILWARSTFLNEELNGNTHSVFCCQPYLFVRLLCCSPAECLHAW